MQIFNEHKEEGWAILPQSTSIPTEYFENARETGMTRYLLQGPGGSVMPRLRRSFVEGLPVHVHQRGNNRSNMFHDTRDRVVFLMALLEASRRYAVAIHAWVLMNTHVHLLVTPQTPDSLARMMQQTGRRYVPYVNRRHDRTGGLWEGRYSAHLIDTEIYWFRCHRYVEMNPVRAAMVQAPLEYPWSSYHVHALGAADALVTPHPLYLASGSTSLERQVAHRTRCGTPLTDAELASIRNALRTGLSGAELPEATALVPAS